MYQVSKTDFEVLVTIYKLLDRKGGSCAHGFKRSLITEHSSVSPQTLSYRIKNSYLLEKQLKENIA